MKKPKANTNSTKDFFCEKAVENSCYKPIKVIFDTLLLNKKVIQQELADYLQKDKAYISRIVNGLEVPPLPLRLKIANYFGVDSCLIWRYEDLPYIKEILQENQK